MHKAKYDLSVLMIFFTRPDTLKEVFAEVKKARPARLFLACDGPREGNPKDGERVAQCKEIVSDIDWECEVHTLYSDVNKGCGRGPSDAISWAFNYTDKLVILEDDCVPNSSFFPYMEELLNRYENDSRIGMVSGLNHYYQWDCGKDSYCFTKTGAIWGWGTWKRVWDQYDYFIDKINDPMYVHQLKKEIAHKRAAKHRIAIWKQTSFDAHRKKIQHWDHQFGFLKYMQSYLSIVPKYNLICNIGAGEGSTHAQKVQEKKWKPGRLLFMPTKEMEFPLEHPDYVICDRYYDEKYFNTMAYLPKAVRLYRKIKRRLFGL